MPFKSDRKRQRKLAFSPLPSSSPVSKGYDKQIRDRAATVVLDGSPSPTKRRKTPIVLDEEEPASAIPTPPDEVEEDSDDKPVRPTPRQGRRAKQQRLDLSSAREPSSVDPAVKLASSQKRTKSTKAGIFSSQAQGQIVESSSKESDNEDDEDDVIVPSQRRFKGRSEKSKTQEPTRHVTRSSAPVVVSDNESEEIAVSTAKPVQQAPEESDDDEDDMPTTMGTQRRQRNRRASRSSFIDDSSPPPAELQSLSRRKRRQEPSGDPPDSPPVAIDSDDDLIIIEQPSRKRRRQASSDEDEDEAPKTPRRRLKQPRQMTQQEKQDLDDDLEFLKPSSDEEADRPFRSTQSAQKNARQKALQKLKQKRGQSSQMAPVEEDDENESGADEDDDVQMIDDDEVDENEELPQYTSSRSIFREDEEDADFLVDEEEEEADPLGVPEGIPIQFTKWASMKAKELFKFAVSWFVQRKINPAFARNHELYRLAFRKLDDEVQGLSNSKFTSSAWVPNFVIALQARPEIAFKKTSQGENSFKDKCDACNRSGHPATYELQFQGTPYHRETLDEVTNEDDEDDDSDDDSTSNNDEKPEYDVQGRQVLPATTIFYVGKFCKANADSAHSLYHWRYHLAEAVEGYLDGSGYLTPRQLAKRDKMSDERRRKKANKISDRMEKAGEMQRLWKLFRENIDNARNAKQGGRYMTDSP